MTILEITKQAYENAGLKFPKAKEILYSETPRKFTPGMLCEVRWTHNGTNSKATHLAKIGRTQMGEYFVCKKCAQYVLDGRWNITSINEPSFVEKWTRVIKSGQRTTSKWATRE